MYIQHRPIYTYAKLHKNHIEKLLLAALQSQDKSESRFMRHENIHVQ